MSLSIHYKQLYSWAFLSLFSIVLSQNNYTVKGMVISESSGTPVVGAHLQLDNHTTQSSKTGSFSFTHISEGEHLLSITHANYESQEINLSVYSDIENVEIDLYKDEVNLDDVVVLGKSEEDKMHELPMTIVNVSESFLESNRENSLMQTLNKLPGVSSINVGSGQSKPVIRGLGFNRVSVFEKGIKHEAQQWGNDHGLEIDQYGVERIHIIKGASSLLYGSDAIGGVVDIQSPKIPKPNSFEGEVNLLGESINDLLGLSSGIQSRKEKWFYRARLTYRDYADYKVPTDKINYESYVFNLHNKRLRNTAGREANASFSIGYKGDNLSSETFFSNVNAKNGFFANAHGLEVRTSDIDYDAHSRDIDLPYHKVNHFKAINNTNFYLFRHTIQLELGFQNNYREEHSEPVPHGYMPKPDNSQERVFKKNTFSINLKDDFKAGNNHHIVFGMNSEFQDNTIGGWGFLIPEYQRFTIGTFAVDHFDISEDLHFQGGLRYDFGTMHTHAYRDWFQSTVFNADNSVSHIYKYRAVNKTLNFNNFSGSVGLSYTPNKMTYKLNLGKSFRIPLANELASDGVNYHMYRYEKGNINLDPEESYQIDMDFEYNCERLNIQFSPFVNWFQNFIYLNPTSNYYETLQIYEYTQSEVFRTGAELSVGFNLLENLRLDNSLEYVYSEQMSGPKKGFTIPFSPPLSTLISAQYRIKKDWHFMHNMQLMADYRLTASQNDIVPPEEKTEGYQVLNLSFTSQLHLFNNNQLIDFRFKINNVFNTQYFNHTSYYRLIDVPEPGRNISMSLTLPFLKLLNNN